MQKVCSFHQKSDIQKILSAVGLKWPAIAVTDVIVTINKKKFVLDFNFSYGDDYKTLVYKKISNFYKYLRLKKVLKMLK